MKIKRDLYERVGVKEYWLIYQITSNGRYGRPGAYAAGDQVKVGVVPDLIVDLASVFGSG
jgi:hypothetical protein